MLGGSTVGALIAFLLAQRCALNAKCNSNMFVLLKQHSHINDVTELAAGFRELLGFGCDINAESVVHHLKCT